MVLAREGGRGHVYHCSIAIVTTHGRKVVLRGHDVQRRNSIPADRICKRGLPAGSRELGVGDDEFSYAYDGDRCKLWHGSRHDDFGRAWEAGDVIGCYLDLDEGIILFTVNGDLVEFDDEDEDGTETGLRRRCWRKVVPRAHAQERDVPREFRRAGFRSSGGARGLLAGGARGGAARAAAGLRHKRSEL